VSEIVLIRHAATQWSIAGKHTGRTDLPLTDGGRQAAAQTAARLTGWKFERVLSSPLRRARETCEICGLAPQAESLDALMEWDYGDYEGLTTQEIQRRRPGWALWRDGCPGGESASEVGARVDSVISLLSDLSGDAAIFAHGHVLRVLGARWIAAAPELGARLMLSTAAISVLGHEHGAQAIGRWNEGG
jgi:broad specificity phosphatase PhoE